MDPRQPAAGVLIVAESPEKEEALKDAIERRGWRARLVSRERLPDGPDLETFSVAFVDLGCATDVYRKLLVRGVRVVALGNRQNSGEVLRALRLGAHDFLDRENVEGDIDAILERHGADWQGALIEYLDRYGEERRAKLAGRLTMGRDPSNDICFQSSVVSRFHAEIRREELGHALVDKGSRHGIYVNSVRVKEHILQDGDTMRLGNAGAPTLIFRSGKRLEDTGSLPSLAGASNREIKDIVTLLDTFLKLKGDLLLDDVLEIVLSRSIELAAADRGMILLREPPAIVGDGPATGEEADAEPVNLRLAIARHRDGTPVEEKPLQISQRIPADVLRTGKGLIFENLLAPDTADAHPRTVQLGVRSAMCVPLRTRRSVAGAEGTPQVLGVLYVDSASRNCPFSPQTLSALESLASEAAQAIFSARLYAASLENRRMDEEMRIAYSVQQDLLPPADYRNPWVELCAASQPSSQVGGDFLNYYSVGENRLGLVVGDVSGKGVPAAMFSAMLDGLCYGLAANSRCLAELDTIAAQVNRHLLARAAPQRFVSLFFGMLLESGQLTYLNAGHNPPLRIDLAGKVEELRTGGMILGVLEEATYETGEVKLAPGDILVLYSDGITEALGSGGERFGKDRLRTVAVESRRLGAASIHRAILDALSEFLAGALPGDDVTLLVARFKS